MRGMTMEASLRAQLAEERALRRVLERKLEKADQDCVEATDNLHKIIDELQNQLREKHKEENV